MQNDNKIQNQLMRVLGFQKKKNQMRSITNMKTNNFAKSEYTLEINLDMFNIVGNVDWLFIIHAVVRNLFRRNNTLIYGFITDLFWVSANTRKTSPYNSLTEVFIAQPITLTPILTLTLT